MKYVLVLIIACTMLACNRVSDKGRELTGKVAKMAREKAMPVMDSVLSKLERRRRKYIGTTPDSTANRELYTDFFDASPTPDVKLDTTFHVYSDYIGIDFTEQLSLQCSEETALRLMKQLQLRSATGKDLIAYGFRDDLYWWNADCLEKLDAWCLINEDKGSYQYAWYDQARHTFYYLNFSM